MSRSLDPKSRDILSFRPNIGFIEPDVEPGVIGGEDAVKVENLLTKRDKVKRLGEAVEALALATQIRADDKAKGMKIKLDPSVDIGTVQAMERFFPGANPLEITYDQYRQVKDHIIAEGVKIGAKANIDPAEVAAERDSALKAQLGIGTNRATQMGGNNTPEAANGGLRPELQSRSQVIEPINIREVQANLLANLANSLWKGFIKPVFDLAGIPEPIGKSIGSLLPDELVKPPEPLDVPGLEQGET